MLIFHIELHCHTEQFIYPLYILSIYTTIFIQFAEVVIKNDKAKAMNVLAQALTYFAQYNLLAQFSMLIVRRNIT